jgi:hypothetical protein
MAAGRILEKGHRSGLIARRTWRKGQTRTAPIRWTPYPCPAKGSAISSEAGAVTMGIGLESASRPPQSAFLISSHTRNQRLAIFKKEQMDTQMSGTYKAKNRMPIIFLARPAQRRKK